MLFKSNPLVLDELCRKYIHLFCLEPEAASCFLLFVALPPPAVDIDSPGGHEHQAPLSPHQMHRLPGTEDIPLKWLMSYISVLRIKAVGKGYLVYFRAKIIIGVPVGSFLIFWILLPLLLWKHTQQTLRWDNKSTTNQNDRTGGVLNLSSLFGTGLSFFASSLFSLLSLLGSLFFLSFSVPLFFFLDLQKKQMNAHITWILSSCHGGKVAQRGTWEQTCCLLCSASRRTSSLKGAMLGTPGSFFTRLLTPFFFASFLSFLWCSRT